jgi:hypothetical protein
MKRSAFVGARGVRLGALVGDAVFGQQIAEDEALVGRAVIAHEALDGEAVAAEPGKGVRCEGDRAFLALSGQQRGVGEPAGIIDGDVAVLPACAALVAVAGSITGDAMADTINAAKLLDIEVEQLARTVAFVANDRGPVIERAKPTEAVAAQYQANRRRWPAQAARSPGRSGAGGEG